MIGYLDCSSGISGDKFLGALVDAGFTATDLQRGLDELALGIEVSSARVTRGGIAGVAIAIEAPGPQPERTWADIRHLIETSGLPQAVRDRSLHAFESLAQAEARVHNLPAEEVHFHEVGAADSIADIVGVCLGLHALGIERLSASPVAVGGGTVASSHGTLPVPAPATAHLLVGVPLDGDAGAGELTTPTGAALLAATVDSFGTPPDMTLSAIGRGAGALETTRPNIATLFLGEPPEAPSETGDTVVELAANIDHITPEHVAAAAERLLAAGALDVWTEPVVMKKGRPGWVLHALTTPGDAVRLAEDMLRQTGSLGIRMRSYERVILPREVRECSTSFGQVRFKVALSPEGPAARPEADDVARIARERGLSFGEVSATLVREAEHLFGK